MAELTCANRNCSVEIKDEKFAWVPVGQLPSEVSYLRDLVVCPECGKSIRDMIKIRRLKGTTLRLDRARRKFLERFLRVVADGKVQDNGCAICGEEETPRFITWLPSEHREALDPVLHRELCRRHARWAFIAKLTTSTKERFEQKQEEIFQQKLERFQRQNGKLDDHKVAKLNNYRKK